MGAIGEADGRGGGVARWQGGKVAEWQGGIVAGWQREFGRFDYDSESDID